jgi:AbrB family looped-hinge helix DNA binding protein
LEFERARQWKHKIDLTFADSYIEAKEEKIMNAEVVRINDGQIMLPADIRQKLGLRDGDRVVFIEENNQIILANAAKVAFAEMRQTFAGEAQRLNLENEQDVVTLVDEVREGIWKTNYAHSA